MSYRHARVLAAGGAAVLMAALGATAAAASGTWTVQPGGSIQAKAHLFFTIHDDSDFQTILCATTFSGALQSGSGLPGAGVGSLSAVSFRKCQIGSRRYAVQAVDLPWQVNFSRYNAAKGVARGTISHIRITESADGCSFVIAGPTVGSPGRNAFRYANSTGRLFMVNPSGNMHFYGVSTGCHGAFHDGDSVSLQSRYTLSPKQAITSP
jgi:hypothetical protein